MTKRGLLIRNPAARGAPSLERLREAVEGVREWEISIETTRAAGHATDLARAAAAASLDAVIASGGDGTVNEAANGLAGSATALAVMRAGTANVWAKEARLPRDPAAATRLLNDGETRVIDLGRAGDRYFVNIAGVGFDAAIVQDVSGGLKRRLGATAYVLHGLRRLLSYRTRKAKCLADSELLANELYWLLLANTRSYAGVLNIASLAVADDGQIEAYLLRRGGFLRILWLVPSVLLGRHHSGDSVLYRRVASFSVDAPGLPVQVDGEYIGETPMRFEVAPGALRVIVPRDLRSPLFTR